MKYNIITLDAEQRDYYKRMIRMRVKSIPEVHIPAVNGMTCDLDEELAKRGLEVTSEWSLSKGEIGIWLSMFDCWQWCVDNDEALVVFEDDAFPKRDFDEKFRALMRDVPDDWDFVCLWVPENQLVDYQYLVWYDEVGSPNIQGIMPEELSLYDFGATRAARVYNGYGNVAMAYSPKGARTFQERVRKAGLYTPVDCFQYLEAHAGRVNGYGPKPKYANLVRYDWPETTIHNTERYEK